MTSDPGDRGPNAEKLAGAFMGISILTVVIRFWSRLITKNKLWWDDWLVLAALVLAIAQCSLTLYWVSIGLGKHVHDVTPLNIVTGLRILFASYFIYNIGIFLTKLSALFFYARIFKVNRKFANALWAVGALSIAWILFAVLSAIWQCKPISKAWNPREPGTCLNYYQWWLGSAISSVIIDAIILVMPLPSLWELHLKLGRKLLVLFVFICGYAVIAISIGRLVANIRTGHELQLDITYNIIPIGNWLLVENPIAIISVCLPCVFSLIKKGIKEGPHSLVSSKSKFSSRRLRTPNSDGSEQPVKNQSTDKFSEGVNIGWDPKWDSENVEALALESRSGSQNGIDRV